MRIWNKDSSIMVFTNDLQLLMLEILEQYIGLQDNDLDILHYKIIKSIKRT